MTDRTQYLEIMFRSYLKEYTPTEFVTALQNASKYGKVFDCNEGISGITEDNLNLWFDALEQLEVVAINIECPIKHFNT
jgi:hypothetical protein